MTDDELAFGVEPFEVPAELVELDELWEQYADECGLGPSEEYLLFGDAGPSEQYIADHVYVALGGCPADEHPWSLDPAYVDDAEYEWAREEAESEYESERERLVELLHDARNADRRAVRLQPSRAPVRVSHGRPRGRRAPRGRRVAGTRSRARSPGRSTGDDDPSHRPPLTPRREARA